MIRRAFELPQKAIELTFYFLLAIVPFVFTPATSELFEMPKMFLIYSGTVLIVFFWLVKSILAGKFLFRRTILDLPLLLFLLSSTLSTFVSIDRWTSIFGFYSRINGGLLSAICYSLLYWAWVSNMTTRNLQLAIRFLLASVLLISVWAIFEHFGHSPSCLLLKGNFGVSCWAPKVQERAFATFGQPNWLAAWLVMIAPLSWHALLEHESKRVKGHESNKKSGKLILLYSLTLILFSAVLFTKSRSGFLAFIVAFVLFWVLTFLKTHFKHLKVFLLLITYHLSLVTIFGSPWTPSAKDVVAQFIARPSIESPLYPISPQSPVSPPVGTESLDIRKIVWKGAVGVWKANPILGTGPETFAYSYYNFRPVEHNKTSEWDLLYNKAHNEYLNYLANTGVAGLTTYLLLIGTFLWKSAIWLKVKSKMLNGEGLDLFTLHLSLFTGYASILITNFTGFSISQTSLLFFLYPAMAITITRDMKHETRSSTSLVKLLSVLIVLPVTCYLLLRVFGLYWADTLYTRAKYLNEHSDPRGAVKKLDQALKWKPNEPRYYDELADSTSQIVSLYELSESEMVSVAESTKEISDKSVKISPRNVSFWSNRAIYFKRLASIDEKYLEVAIKSLEEAVRLAPTEPSFIYNLAVLYEYSGQREKALEAAKKSLALKPDYDAPRDLLNTLSN
ncbi:MAG: O-antigen ligase family protein [Patescibacteria group bacterium]